MSVTGVSKDDFNSEVINHLIKPESFALCADRGETEGADPLDAINMTGEKP